MSKFEIPKELEKAICSNQLIVFVGAGLSYNLKNIKDEPLNSKNVPNNPATEDPIKGIKTNNKYII